MDYYRSMSREFRAALYMQDPYLHQTPPGKRCGYPFKLSESQRCQLYDHSKRRRKIALTEGDDFESWAAIVDAQLRAINCNAYVSTQSPLQVREPHRRSARRFLKMEAALFILSRVCRSIRSRIPVAALNEPHLMWTAIEALAKPFKFTALPAELRNQIYRKTLEPLKEVNIARCHCQQSAMPSLMHTSRQLRSEYGSIYYAETAFTGHTLIRNESYAELPTSRLLKDDMIQTWFMSIAQPFWGHLRHFSIMIVEDRRGYVNSWNFKLQYNDSEGHGRLVAILPQNLNKEWKSKIFDWVEEVNTAAEAGGWAGGERIVGVIMARRKVWMPR